MVKKSSGTSIITPLFRAVVEIGWCVIGCLWRVLRFGGFFDCQL